MLSIHIFRMCFVACPVTPAAWWRFQPKGGAGIHGHSAPQLPDFNPPKKIQVFCYSKHKTFKSLTSSETPRCQQRSAKSTLLLRSHQCHIKPCRFFPSSYAIKHTKQHSLRHVLNFYMLHTWSLLHFFILPGSCTFISAKTL